MTFYSPFSPSCRRPIGTRHLWSTGGGGASRRIPPPGPSSASRSRRARAGSASADAAARWLARPRHAQLRRLELVQAGESDLRPILAAAPATIRSLLLAAAPATIRSGSLAHLSALTTLELSLATEAGYGRYDPRTLAAAFAGAGSNLAEIRLGGDLAVDLGDAEGGRGHGFVTEILASGIEPAALCFESFAGTDPAALASALRGCIARGVRGVADVSYER
eukprot:tig00000870_g5118.t1